MQGHPLRTTVLCTQMPAVAESLNDAVLLLLVMPLFLYELRFSRAAVHAPRRGVGRVVVCIYVKEERE